MHVRTTSHWHLYLILAVAGVAVTGCGLTGKQRLAASPAADASTRPQRLSDADVANPRRRVATHDASLLASRSLPKNTQQRQSGSTQDGSIQLINHELDDGAVASVLSDESKSLEAVSKPGGRGSHRAETSRDTSSAGASPSQDLVSKLLLEEVSKPDSMPQSRLSLRESSASFAEREATNRVLRPSLDELIELALQSNPGLRRRAHEVDAAWSRVPQVRALPDPMLGANGFGSPIETAAGGQRANLLLSQRFPSLKRLDAQGQQAAYEALALEQVWQAERLKIVANVKVISAKLYVVGHQTRINRENQKLLKSLIEVSIQRVGQALGSQGDVLLGTLELSRLAEELIELRQRRLSLQARLNELLNRPAETEVAIPEKMTVNSPDATLEELRQQTRDHQPEIVAAQLRAHATAWGIEVASLARTPDFSVNFNWFFIDNNRPRSTVVEVGEDAWSLGATISLPIWRDKYDAMESEAGRRHYATQAATESIIRRYDALLADLLAQAEAANETVNLYDNTILPQAHQTLEADQQSYSQGQVEFDRVIRDLRTLLRLEFNRYRAQGDLAIANAGIEQAIGIPPKHAD